MKKRIAAVIMAAVMAISAAVPAFAGTWSTYGGKWYFADPTVNYNNDFLTGWQWIDGYCYYMDPNAGGAMLVSTITPDGFPVDELGRMTDSDGEPYYIPGYGLNATTAGPGDYTDDTVYAGYYDYDDLLAELLDLLYGNHYDDRARRRNDEPRRRDPDTITVQIEVVGGQPDKAPDPAGQPDNASDPAGITAGQPDKAPDPIEMAQEAIKKAQEEAEKAEESAEKSEEQTSDSVISAGSGQSQGQNSQSNSGQTTQDHTERPAQRQRGQAGAGGSSAASGSTEDENFPFPLIP